jgi:hypothetical protein
MPLHFQPLDLTRPEAHVQAAIREEIDARVLRRLIMRMAPGIARETRTETVRRLVFPRLHVTESPIGQTHTTTRGRSSRVSSGRSNQPLQSPHPRVLTPVLLRLEVPTIMMGTLLGLVLQTQPIRLPLSGATELSPHLLFENCSCMMAGWQ